MFGIVAAVAGVYLMSIAAGSAVALTGDPVGGVISTVTKLTSTATQLAPTVPKATTPTVVSAPNVSTPSLPSSPSGAGTVSVGGSTPSSSVTVGAGGSPVTTATGGSFQAPPGTQYTVDGRTYTVPASGVATVPAGASFVLPPQGGTIAATPAPGFVAASGRFVLAGAPPPPAGTPNLLVPFPSVLLEGTYTPRGVQVRRLRITAKGALVRVSCLRRCPRRLRGQAVQARALRAFRFTRFQRRYRAGAMLRIRVVQQGKIGKYVRFTVKRRKPPSRLDLCTNGLAERAIRCPR